eukprot:gene1838-3553_t
MSLKYTSMNNYHDYEDSPLLPSSSGTSAETSNDGIKLHKNLILMSISFAISVGTQICCMKYSSVLLSQNLAYISAAQLASLLNKAFVVTLGGGMLVCLGITLYVVPEQSLSLTDIGVSLPILALYGAAKSILMSVFRSVVSDLFPTKIDPCITAFATQQLAYTAATTTIYFAYDSMTLSEVSFVVVFTSFLGLLCYHLSIYNAPVPTENAVRVASYVI